MNYLKIYIKLIRKAQNRQLPDETYTELHHIFPKSIYGNNNLLVKLTFKEHVVAHHLLYLICKKRYGEGHFKTIKMAYAIKSFFASIKRESISDKDLIRLVSTIQDKIRYSHTQETKTLLSKKLSGENNPNYGRTGDKHPLFGKKASKETRNKQSKSHKERNIKGKDHHLYGKDPWNKGKSGKRFEEISRKGRKKAIETTKKRRLESNEKRYSFINKNTNEIEKNVFISDMVHKYGLSGGNLHSVIHGKRTHTKGWKILENSETRKSN